MIRIRHPKELYRLVLILVLFGHKVVEARTGVEELLEGVNKPVIKTIQSEDGDIVDCVDIYKQPAFDNPLLINHTIKMRPSFYPKWLEEGNFSSEMITAQTWRKSGSCPDGTVPIRRENSVVNGYEPGNCKVETAGVQSYALPEISMYYGVSAEINVWSPVVVASEWSLNSVTALDGTNLVETGYGVSPVMFGDSRPRIFANWRNGGKGCFNLKCSGFVQVSKDVMLGAGLHPVSQYDGNQYKTRHAVYKDDIQHIWWLMFFDKAVGYWPISLFSGLHNAPLVQWLGRVCNTEPKGSHTTTQMGSGHYPYEGFRRSAYMKDMRYMYQFTDFVSLLHYDFVASSVECYNVKSWKWKDSDMGTSMFFGGPGGSCCDGCK